MRYLETKHYLGDALAGHCLAQCHGNAAGEKLQGYIFILGKVEKVVDLVLGHYQHMAFAYRVDVEEGVVVFVFGNAVRRYLAGYYARKD